MDVEALSRLKACRLSFIQTLVRRMIRERWRIEPVQWRLDSKGRGEARYEIRAGSWVFTLIVFSDSLTEEEQEERIVATKWDVMAALVEGRPDEDAVARLREEIPQVIDGRMGESGLMWCRANRSSRVFEHTVEQLAQGRQPDISLIAEAGYLMRTLDFRANGLNGSQVLLVYPPDHPLRGPFFAQMLGCYVVRQFSLDLVEHIARCRSETAATLARPIARYVGVGNSSGIGLVLFLLAQPHLLDRWLTLRFIAQARIRGLGVRASLERGRVEEVLRRRIVYAREDLTDYGGVFTSSVRIAEDLERAAAAAAASGSLADVSWGEFLDRLAPELDRESIEVMHAVLMEAHPEASDDLADRLVVEAQPAWPPGATSAGALLEVLSQHFGWALRVPLDDPDDRYYFWYKSAEHEEPRLGVRGEETGEDLTIDVVGDAQALAAVLRGVLSELPVSRVLVAHPELRPMLRRVWASRQLRYHTPYMNSTERSFSSVHPMRLVLSGLKGLEKLYPMSDKWVRSVMMQGAPLADEVAAGVDEDWMYPERPCAR